MILPIVLYGNPILRETAKEVEKNHPNIKELVENMYETMRKADGVGLAAPQIGLSLRLFVVDVTTLKNDKDLKADLANSPFTLTLLNPEILERTGEVISREEGCLSLPQIHEKVARNNHIKIKYYDTDFQEHIDEYDGFFARIIQHEFDHIEGHVFTDRISPIRKQLIKSKLLNVIKRKTKVEYKIK
ncbi:MAG: peptide deformylase [Prevotellaceae bacterium]|jgi:peptide deformylase|nr:peptide deformylase [Prevotellaceae bacterium]